MKKLYCKECDKEISMLLNQSTTWHEYFFTLDNKGYTNYEENKTWDGGDNLYACPKCNAVLFSDEVSAIKFLKGEI